MHKSYLWDFPCGPVVKTLNFRFKGAEGSIPGGGTKISLGVVRPKQKTLPVNLI